MDFLPSIIVALIKKKIAFKRVKKKTRLIKL